MYGVTEIVFSVTITGFVVSQTKNAKLFSETFQRPEGILSC